MLICPACSKMIKNRGALHLHMQKHGEPAPEKCSEDGHEWVEINPEGTELEKTAYKAGYYFICENCYQLLTCEE